VVWLMIHSEFCEEISYSHSIVPGGFEVMS
jgi:hypothetical protein